MGMLLFRRKLHAFVGMVRVEKIFRVRRVREGSLVRGSLRKMGLKVYKEEK